LPEEAPELWLESEEKRQADAKEMNRDDAVISFTARVYGQWFGDYRTGMGLSEINPLDPDCYEELKGVRNRMNGRKEKFPFPTVKDRNKALVEEIVQGNMLPPKSLTLHRTLEAVAKRGGTPFAQMDGTKKLA
jgi:hypothetical protein